MGESRIHDPTATALLVRGQCSVCTKGGGRSLICDARTYVRVKGTSPKGIFVRARLWVRSEPCARASPPPATQPRREVQNRHREARATTGVGGRWRRWRRRQQSHNNTYKIRHNRGRRGRQGIGKGVSRGASHCFRRWRRRRRMARACATESDN